MKTKINKNFFRINHRSRLPLLFGLVFLLLVLPVVFYTSKHTKKVAAAWYNDSWGYRQKIPISTHTTAETNVYLGITVDTATLTTDKLQADCDDLRFTDVSGKLLPYQIVSGCDAA